MHNWLYLEVSPTSAPSSSRSWAKPTNTKGSCLDLRVWLGRLMKSKFWEESRVSCRGMICQEILWVVQSRVCSCRRARNPRTRSSTLVCKVLLKSAGDRGGWQSQQLNPHIHSLDHSLGWRSEIERNLRPYQSRDKSQGQECSYQEARFKTYSVWNRTKEMKSKSTSWVWASWNSARLASSSQKEYRMVQKHKDEAVPQRVRGRCRHCWSQDIPRNIMRSPSKGLRRREKKAQMAKFLLAAQRPNFQGR